MKTGKELRAVLGLEGGNIPLLNVTWETGQLAVREQGKKSLKRHHGLPSSKQLSFYFVFYFPTNALLKCLCFKELPTSLTVS